MNLKIYKHGSDKAVCTCHLPLILCQVVLKKKPLASIRGNCFNILFYDAGAVYYISDAVKTFFGVIWQTLNQLLRAGLSDIEVPEYLAGCRALELVNKVFTGHLWHGMFLKHLISILDMNYYLEMLIVHMDLWSLAASEVLHGVTVLYPNFRPTEDAQFNYSYGYRPCHSTDTSDHFQCILIITVLVCK